MANQRSTFGKRNREMKLKDRQRDKAQRLAARRAENKEAKGPQIAWDEAGGVGSLQNETPAASAPPAPAPAPAPASAPASGPAPVPTPSRKPDR